MKKSIKFIVIDGPDGVGKTTQLNQLKLKLTENGKNIHFTRALGGTGDDYFQNSIRKVVLSDKFPKDDHVLEEKLFSLGDLTALNEARDFLKENNDGFILKDRGIASHFCYAGTGSLSESELVKIHADLMRAELYIDKEFGLLNILLVPDTVKWAHDRITQRAKDKGEKIVERLENLGNQEKVLAALKLFPSRTVSKGMHFELIKIKDDDTIYDIQDKIFHVLDKYTIDKTP